MRAFIIGITGGTGSRLARQLQMRGDDVGGLYRRREQWERLAELGLRGTLGDLQEMSERALADSMRGNDVVIYSAGATDIDSDSSIDAVDGDGVARSSAAARRAGIQRFMLVSVFPEAGRDRPMLESFERYMRAKKRAEVALVKTDLDWVIVRPSSLSDNPGVGRVNLSPAEFHTEICRDDVAAVLAELVHTPSIRRSIFELTEGATPIAAAVANLTVRENSP
jgi:uncharacterized protein YbjT (DUF2867 family)